MKMDYFKTYFKKKFKTLTEEILPVMSKCGLCDSNCVILEASISSLIKLADDDDRNYLQNFITGYF